MMLEPLWLPKLFKVAFQGDQILAACHWKSHNTFTQFYLKDVAWADSELFHLGPVVAAADPPLNLLCSYHLYSVHNSFLLV